MANTWPRVVDCSLDMRLRACVFCGAVVQGIYKVASIDDVEQIVRRQQHRLRADPIHCVYANLCASALCAAAVDSPESFMSCACCQHWVSKRAHHHNVQFPMQALKAFFQSMPCVRGKKLDTRVVHRLCSALCAETDGACNFFRSLFDGEELALCAQVAAASVSDVTRLVAMFIYEQNARSLFLCDVRLTEIVRECLSADRGLACVKSSGLE